MKNQLKALTSIVALTLSGHAFAATTWNLVGAASNFPTSGVGVSAVANTGGTDDTTGAANNGATQTIQSATWMGQTNTGTQSNPFYYGGIKNLECTSGANCDQDEGSNPEHAIDNNQRYDMALLTFSSAVKLTQMKLSWYQDDSDVTVMAYTGSGTPTLIGKTYSQLALANSGWSVIGNYGNVGSTNSKTINTNGVFSSYWLIGAYNPLVSGSTTGSMLTDSYDYVKLSSVTGDCKYANCTPPSNVPEPGSLALMGIGLLGLLRMRKVTKA